MLIEKWHFFALTFGWTWLFWIAAAVSGQSIEALPVRLLLYLGGIGPALAGILLTYLTQDREGRRDFWRRLIDPRRIGVGWYGAILLTVPLLTAVALLLDFLSGGSLPQFEEATRLLSQPLTVLPLVLFTLLFGPLPEELGWRGYVLDRLQARWNALSSSLVLGVAWALWHLPLFLMEGTFQHEMGLGSRSFWLYMIAVVPTTVLMTWIYNNTRRSTLSAVLFHFMVNFTGRLFELGVKAEPYQVLMWVVAAIAVTIIWGPETLTRRQRAKQLKRGRKCHAQTSCTSR
ncbi:MAG TPA: CPBP family intramembrane metalloprotease [Anaerolineae bacterium]|nr:CPBP family intramembrane metalloprotease [Anaerolineae bacterium]